MPNISEIITNREKKFKKRNYRSWDLTGSEIDLFLNKKNPKISKSLSEKSEEQKATSEKKEKSAIKTGVKVEPNWSQTGAKSEPNRSQSRAKLEPHLSKTGAKLETQLEPELESNRSQSRAKLEPNWSQNNINIPQKEDASFLQLSGLQKEIILFIYNVCKNNRTEITEPISIRNIASIARATISSAKKAIQRLEEKKSLNRVQFKNGRGGWSTYTLTKSIYQEILQLETQHKIFNNWSQTGAKVEPNWSQTGAKVETQLEPELEPCSPSSSSNIINRSTTTKFVVDEINLDIVPLESIGFKKEHLAQITKQGLIEPTLIQQSIYAFAHDLENGNISIKKSPLTYFMGILRRGDPYAPASSDYISPGEKARKLYIEKLKQQKEEEEIIENDLVRNQYLEWSRQLSEKEKENLTKKQLPDNLKNQWFRFLHDTLEKYFKESIWPDDRLKIYKEKGLPVPKDIKS